MNMDRASIHDLFYGNGTGNNNNNSNSGNNNNAAGAGSNNNNGAVQEQLPNLSLDGTAAVGGIFDQQSDASGYPLLLQQYLRQQQQQQHQDTMQQQMAAAALENTMGAFGSAGMQMPNPTGTAMIMNPSSFANFSTDTSTAPMMGQSSALGSFQQQQQQQQQGGLNNWMGMATTTTGPVTSSMVAGPPSMANTQVSSTSDLSSSGRVIMDRLQHRQQQQQQQQLRQLQQQQQQHQGRPNAAFLSTAAGAGGGNTTAQSDPYAEQGILGPWSERSAGLLGKMVCTDPSNQPTKAKRVRRKQPKDKPKRPLSAYNIFFKEERARLLEQGQGGEKRTANGKIGFEDLAKIIGGKWQDLKPAEVEYYKDKAASDMQRYKGEMEVYNKKQKANSSSNNSTKSDPQSSGNEDAESGDSDRGESNKRRKTA